MSNPSRHALSCPRCSVPLCWNQIVDVKVHQLKRPQHWPSMILRWPAACSVECKTAVSSPVANIGKAMRRCTYTRPFNAWCIRFHGSWSAATAVNSDLLVQIPAAMSAEMVSDCIHRRNSTHKAEGRSLSSISRAVDAVLLSMNAGCRKSLCWVQS